MNEQLLLRIVPSILQKIHSALTLDAMINFSLCHTLEALHCNDGAILLLDHTSDEGVTVRNSWLAGSFEHPHQLTTECQTFLAREVVQQGSFLLYADTNQMPDEFIALYNNALPSLICIPIEAEQRILGLFIIANKEREFFHEALIYLVGEISQHIALSVENHILHMISKELSTLPAEDILPKITEAACFISAARASIVLLSDNGTDDSIRNVKYPVSESRPYSPRRNGLTQRIVNSCQPFIISDAQNDERVRDTTKKRGIQAILGIPLQITQHQNDLAEIRAIGALYIEVVSSREFSQREQEIIQNLANQAAITIQNQRQTKTLRQLNINSFEIISARQDIPELTNTILARAIKLTDADGGRICLLSEDLSEVQLQNKLNFPGPPIDIDKATTRGVFGHVVKTTKPFTKSNYGGWSERRKDFDNYGFSAVAGVPILLGEQLWGVITLHDTREGRVFDEQAIETLTNLGNLSAAVLSNASRANDLERIIESAFACVIAVDKQGNITHFNQQAEQMLHYTREEVIGLPITEIYASLEDARAVQRKMYNSPDGKFKEYNTSLKSKKGHGIPIKLSASLLYDYKDKPSGSVGFFYDQRRHNARIAISSLLDRQEIFEAIVQQAYEITRASHSTHLALSNSSNSNLLEVTVAYPQVALSKKQELAIDIENDERIGISGRAFKEEISQLVPDVTLDPDYISHDKKTHSELSVPITTSTGVIGIIDVQHAEKNAFNETDQRNLETLAQCAAIAIHNAQLYEEIQTDRRRFETIANIIRDATKTVEINLLLKTTCQRVESIFKGKNAIASIRLYDKDEKLLRFEPEWHESFHSSLATHLEKERTTQPLSEGLCGLVARTRRSKNVGNVTLEPAFSRLISSTKSELTVPIHLDEGDELIGVLDLQSSDFHAFTQNDLDFLEVLAKQLAIDIHKAQLAEQAKMRANDAAAFRDAATHAVDELELQETLDRLTLQTYQLAKNRNLKINSAILRVVEKEKRVLAAAQPSALLPKLQQERFSIPIKEGLYGRKGIASRAIIEAKTQIVHDVSSDPDYLLLSRKTKSELVIPIIIDDVVIAVMDMEFTKKSAVNEEDQQIFEALATQAGIAIERANQYKMLARRYRHQEAVYKASRIISRNVSDPQRKILYRILEQAVERIVPTSGKKAILGTLQLYNSQTQELTRECIYPIGTADTLIRELGEVRSIIRTGPNQIGINGRAVLEGKSQLVGNVLSDPDYIQLSEHTRSEMDVVLFDEEKNTIGVLGLESSEDDAFDDEDVSALRSLADLAVIAIRNARQYQELEQTKGKLLTRSAIAFLATDRAAWQHKISGHIGAIDTYVALLENDLVANRFKEKAPERIAYIKELIAKTREKKIAQPLAPDQGLEIVHADQFIDHWVKSVYLKELFPNVVLLPDPHAGNAQIEVNRGWFKLALDNILNNALRAVKDMPIQKITVTTQIVDDMLKIFITDTGPGIPEKLQPLMFKELVPKKIGGRGEGIGQMLSKTIFEIYGGDVELVSTSKQGTNIVIYIPCTMTHDELAHPKSKPVLA